MASNAVKILGAIKKIPLEKIIANGKKAVPVLKSIANNKELQATLDPVLKSAIGEKNAGTIVKISNMVEDPTNAIISVLKKKLQGTPLRDITVVKDEKSRPSMIVFELPFLGDKNDPELQELLEFAISLSKKVLPHKLLVNNPGKNYSKLFLCKRPEDCKEHL